MYIPFIMNIEIYGFIYTFTVNGLSVHLYTNWFWSIFVYVFRVYTLFVQSLHTVCNLFLIFRLSASKSNLIWAAHKSLQSASFFVKVFKLCFHRFKFTEQTLVDSYDELCSCDTWVLDCLMQTNAALCNRRVRFIYLRELLLVLTLCWRANALAGGI